MYHELMISVEKHERSCANTILCYVNTGGSGKKETVRFEGASLCVFVFFCCLSFLNDLTFVYWIHAAFAYFRLR